MKTKMILFTMLFCPILLLGQIWDYPIKPGSEEWKKLMSNKEMVESCQIPEKVLSNLSTEDLTELCLSYPLLYDLFAFENFTEGFNKLFSDFNGIKELYSRNDISNSLINKYNKKIRSFSFLHEKNTDIEKGEFIISVNVIEILLGQCYLKNKMTGNMSKTILINLVDGYEEKLKVAEYFKGSGFRTNVYSRTHAISKMVKQNLEKLPQKDNNSAFFSGKTDEESIRMIDEMSYQLIK